MLKILVLQRLYNLADDALEYQLLDRRSFQQFLELIESSSIPGAKTIRLFLNRLAQADAGTLVFEQVQQHLQKHAAVPVADGWADEIVFTSYFHIYFRK